MRTLALYMPPEMVSEAAAPAGAHVAQPGNLWCIWLALPVLQTWEHLAARLLYAACSLADVGLALPLVFQNELVVQMMCCMLGFIPRYFNWAMASVADQLHWELDFRIFDGNNSSPAAPVAAPGAMAPQHNFTGGVPGMPPIIVMALPTPAAPGSSGSELWVAVFMIFAGWGGGFGFGVGGHHVARPPAHGPGAGR